MYAKSRSLLAGCAFALTFVSGCTLQKKDDADEFRDAIPQSESIALSGPDASSGTTTTAAAAPSLRTLAAGPAPTTYAKWYGFTRTMRDGVNKITAGVLGSVWLVIHTEPSATTADSATWGPWNDELNPATYRFKVTRIAPDEYNYVLEGRAKASTSDDDYQAVLSGHGYGKPSEKHGQGTFQVDLDVAKALDPFDNQDNSGTVTVDHELPHDFSDNLGALPRTITATVTPQGEAHYSVESVANVDHTGSIHVIAHVDIDDSKRTLLEDVVIDSRWKATGAGRADIDITGGDLPASTPKVDAIECWGTDFTQSYYSDSGGFAPTAGTANACVYSSP
ncbi:MAG TPA: hypothetical protein VIK01_13450 [Polyangiaceae bacterium]